jgi:acyl carrier protein
MDRNTVSAKLNEFFANKLEINPEELGLNGGADLAETGRLDSLSFLVLINFIKKSFKKTVKLADISEGRLNSFSKIVDFIAGEGK